MQLTGGIKMESLTKDEKRNIRFIHCSMIYMPTVPTHIKNNRVREREREKQTESYS